MALVRVIWQAERAYLQIVNPWHACAVRITVVCLSVCLFVDAYSCTTGYEAAHE